MRFILRTAMLLGLFTVALSAYAKRAPNLTFRNLAGADVKLSDLRGSITVVNFWATWCGPCREEMPMLSGLTQTYAGKKVRFIAVSADEDPGNKKNRAKIDQFLVTQKPAMEIWLGADLGTLDRLQLGNVLPATIILDEDGEVVARVLGQAKEEDLKTPLDWLLGGKSGPAPPAIVKHY
ncbi:MAG TPA: TlpA disulfide reductase family protein [Acidobacteriaceae bacterium]|nr:TlpA disulfide reductase family protein [Acidobacteriaceae bacterium]